ncbi:MAG TPA: CBS domain-containing protein [Herpetosiphonaceae bacterium]
MQDTTAPQPKTRAQYEAQTIRYWMRSPAITIHADAPVSEALASMHEHSIRRLPVVTATDKLAGIITDGDIRGADVLHATGLDLRQIASSLQRIPVSEIMTERPIAVTPSSTLREAALLMLDNKIGGLPVVDADNTVVGVITESDLFEALVCYLDWATTHP